MMNEYYANIDQVRLSDGERKAALRRLRRHHRSGRIDGVELEERTDAVGFARHRGDLRTVFADLEPAAPVRGPRGPWAFRRGWFPFFPVFPLLVIVAIVIAATGHIPWVPLGILAFLLLVVAPWRRRRWAHSGYAC
jgi:hypothetical protein